MKNQKEDTENLRKIKKKNDDVDNGKNKKHSLRKKIIKGKIKLNRIGED